MSFQRFISSSHKNTLFADARSPQAAITCTGISQRDHNRHLTKLSSRSTQPDGGRSWLIGLTSRSHRAGSLATAPAGDVSSRTSAFWSLVDESELYTKNWVGVWQRHPYVVLDHLKTPLAIGFFFGGFWFEEQIEKRTRRGNMMLVHMYLILRYSDIPWHSRTSSYQSRAPSSGFGRRAPQILCSNLNLIYS